MTGAVPGTRAETTVANSHILWVEIATVVFVVLILAFYFGSVGVPLLALATVGLAYLGVDRALEWVGSQAGLSFSSEVEPVIVGLLFGVLTDYLVFFVQSFREIGFALAVGLLLDTLIARTLLVPALVAAFGRGSARPPSAVTFPRRAVSSQRARTERAR